MTVAFQYTMVHKCQTQLPLVYQFHRVFDWTGELVFGAVKYEEWILWSVRDGNIPSHHSNLFQDVSILLQTRVPVLEERRDILTRQRCCKFFARIGAHLFSGKRNRSLW